MHVTLRKIAKEAECSTATASRVLSGSQVGVRQEIRRQVLAAAAKFGYRSTTRRILLIAETIVPDLYYANLIAELNKLLCTAGCMVELIGRNSLCLIEERSIAGAIAIAFQDGLERYWGQRHAVPLVCINTRPNHIEGVFSVRNDNETGMLVMLNRLYQAGHRAIGLYGWNFYDHMPQCTVARVHCYEKFMREHALPVDLLASRSRNDDDQAALIKGLLDRGATAIIGGAEGMDLEILHALRLLGKRIPEDVSVASWLTPQLRRFAEPQIFGVMQDYETIAEDAFLMLNEQIAGHGISKDKVVPCIIVSGSSVSGVPRTMAKRRNRT